MRDLPRRIYQVFFGFESPRRLDVYLNKQTNKQIRNQNFSQPGKKSKLRDTPPCRENLFLRYLCFVKRDNRGSSRRVETQIIGKKARLRDPRFLTDHSPRLLLTESHEGMQTRSNVNSFTVVMEPLKFIRSSHSRFCQLYISLPTWCSWNNYFMGFTSSLHFVARDPSAGQR